MMLGGIGGRRRRGRQRMRWLDGITDSMYAGLGSPGGQFGRRYVIPMVTGHMVQSSLKVQDGVSFFLKMESAQPVPFLPQCNCCKDFLKIIYSKGFNLILVIKQVLSKS